MTWLDFRLAARRLCRAPAFTAAAVLLLAISIGGPTFIFSVVRGLLFQSIAYSNPERVVVLVPEMPHGGTVFDELRERRDVFENVGAYTERAANLTDDGPGERVLIARVTSGLLPITGVHPSLGRLFLSDDFRFGSEPVALISHRIWRRRYGGSRDVVGRQLILDSRAHTIVGVLPPHFKTVRQMERARQVPFDRDVAVLIPLPGNPQAYDSSGTDRKSRGVTILVRLRENISVERARKEVAPILSREQARVRAAVPFSIQSLAAAVAGGLSTQLAILSAAVALLLVAGGANVTNLMLGRIEGRRREVAVSVAIGANTRRIVGTILAETLLISGAAGVVGLLLVWQAVIGTKLLSGGLLDLDAVRIDMTVLGFGAMLSAAIGVLVGLGPAIRHARTDPAAVLQAYAGGGRSGARLPLSSILIVTQVALAVVLVVAGALLGRAFLRTVSVEPGFVTTGILTAEISLDRSMYWRRASRTFFAELLDRLAALPGVDGAALVSTVPGGEFVGGTLVRVRGRPYFVDAATVSRDYFSVLSIPVLAGSVWSRDEDTRPGVREVVVNETFAREYWRAPGEALNRQITLGLPSARTSTGAALREPELTIVGVVADSRDAVFTVVQRPKIYWSPKAGALSQLTILVKASSRAPADLAQPLARVVRELHPDPVLYNVLPLDDIVSSRFARERAMAVVMSAFALLTLLVSALGVYASMSYAGALRRREIGVRLALGATRAMLLCTLAWRVVKLVSVGIELGVLFAVISVSLLGAWLFGVGETDFSTIAGAVVLVAVVSAVALLLPAWRATRVDPIVTLRAE